MNWKKALIKLNPFGNKKEEIELELKTSLVEAIKKPVSTAYNWKYSNDQKLLIVTMIAKGMTPHEIVEEAKAKHNMDVKVGTISDYRHAIKWQPIIKKIREEHYANVAEVAGSHKRVRLDRRERIYDKAVKKGDLKTALSAVTGSKDEMEDKSTAGHLNLTLNQYNLMSDEEIEFRKNELLKKLSAKQVIDMPKENANESIQK